MEIKSPMTEVKKAFDGLISKPASAVERTNQLEETSMNTSKTVTAGRYLLCIYLLTVSS